MRVRCDVCKRARDKDTCKAFEPTEKEKLMLSRMGATNVKSVYYYCRPCMRILSSPETGVQLMGGVLQAHARSMGAVNAEELASRYKERLAKLSRPDEPK